MSLLVKWTNAVFSSHRPLKVPYTITTFTHSHSLIQDHTHSCTNKQIGRQFRVKWLPQGYICMVQKEAEVKATTFRLQETYEATVTPPHYKGFLPTIATRIVKEMIQNQ